MVAALGNARLQDMPLVAQTLLAAAQRKAQRGQISTAAVAQLDALEGVPPPFERIELGRRAGQLLQMEALGRSAGEGVLDRLAAMNGRPVPDDEQRAMDFARASRASSGRHPGGARPGLASAGTAVPRA